MQRENSAMSEQEYMKLALQLAEAARGQTSPNPLVGAVIVKDSMIVGMGAHLKSGEAHAEVQAIEMAKEHCQGATIYVTLEPCSHYGKTPPCADLIIQHHFKKVVIATLDPNPKVAGNGVKKLKQAGIEVEVGLLEEEAKELNRWFFHGLQTKRPYVTLKFATTIDGKIATETFDSKWVTSVESRMDVHRYRHMYDAILVGINTVKEDHPSLTTRLPIGGRHPVRVILDTSLRIGEKEPLLHDKMGPVLIFTSSTCNEAKKARLLQNEQVEIYSLHTPTIVLQEVLTVLYKKGILSLLVEGGGLINSSFLQEGLIDELIHYMAPKILGGIDAPSAFRGKGIEKIKDAQTFTLLSSEQIGDDMKFVYRAN